MFKTSKEKTDVTLLNKLAETVSKSEDTDDLGDESPKKKMKVTNSPTKRIDNYFSKTKNHVSPNDSSKSLLDTSSESHNDTKKKHASSQKHAKKKVLQLTPDNPLPDVFKDLKLGFYPDFISFPEEEREIFERHWIAYGGSIVKSVRATDVDYVVHCNSSIEFKKSQKLYNRLGPNVKHINKYWLIKCINNVELCDTSKFAVKVLP